MKKQVRTKPPLDKLLESKDEYLSNDERVLLKEVAENRKHDYLAGRLTLKELFVSNIEGSIKKTDFSISYENHKPQITHLGKKYYCSISHTNHHVACSLDEFGPTGIDIEVLKFRSKEFQDYIVSTPEAELFKQEEAFVATKVWSMKEAAFKSDKQEASLEEYLILERNVDLFLVVNKRTQGQFYVKNQVIDNYTVSYTIPMLHEYESI